MRCKHLSLSERYYIQVKWKKKVSQSKISEAIGRYQSAISREFKRNSEKKYLHNQTDILSHERQSSKIKSVKITEEMKYIVSVCILNGWSPEQVLGRLSENGLSSVHHETIYQYILSDKKNEGQLCKQLRRQRKNIGNAADSLTTALGFQIAETLTNTLPW